MEVLNPVKSVISLGAEIYCNHNYRNQLISFINCLFKQIVAELCYFVIIFFATAQGASFHVPGLCTLSLVSE